MRSLSYSQASTYLACPLSYKLQYIDRLPRKPKSYLSFGATLHRCLAYYYRERRKHPPRLNDLLKFFEETWVSRGYGSEEQEAEDKALGRDILTRFWELHSADFRVPLATERWFSIDLGGISLRGYIDRVDLSERGGLVVLDYKAGKAIPSDDEAEDDLQLTLYQLASQHIWLLPVERLVIYHLRTNTPVDSSPRGPDMLEGARQTLLDVASAIAWGEFPSRLNQFCPCDYPEHCPHFRQQQGA